MSKNLLIIACVSTAFAHGMEEATSLSIVVHGTKINLNKGSVGSADGRVDLMVVGRTQQRTLQQPTLGDSSFVGEIRYAPKRIFYEKNKESESASGDDTYKEFDKVDGKRLWKNAFQTTMNCDVMQVIEPCIMTREYFDDQKDDYVEGFYYYATQRQDSTEVSRICECVGDKAIAQACKDLAVCYNNVLAEGLEKLGAKVDKNIALASLSTAVGLPRDTAAPVAVAAILEFVKNNPKAYSCIELFVKKQLEVESYTALIRQYAENH